MDTADRTRASYDAVAQEYAAWVAADLDHQPLERALLTAFAELVGGERSVLDVGCGPGRIAAHLLGLGLDVTGVDLSPAMVELAHRTHPTLPVEVGTVTSLRWPRESFDGALAWYSLIHVPDPDLPTALDELHRVLAPGGPLLLAFQLGDGVRHYDAGFGHDLDLDFHRRSLDRVADVATDSGLVVDARVRREATAEHELTPQGYLLAHRPRGTHATHGREDDAHG